MKWKTWTAAAAVWMAVSSCLCGCSSTSLKDYERYTYDLTEYVQLGQYKGVTIQDYEMHTVTDADVQQQVLVARSNYAEVRRKTDGAAQNDQLNIDFVGYLDGEEFEGGSASDFDVTIGSGQMLDGFESGLVGVKPGETVTLHLVYPDPYPLDTTLSGKSVQFVVTVNTVNEQILPEYTDAFVKEYYGYDTVAAFEQALCDELIEREETNRENYRMNQVWEAVTAQSEVLQYPETECGELYESYISYYTSVAQEQEMSLNEYASTVLGYAVTEFEDAVWEQARGRVGEEMILYAIARAESISVGTREYKDGAMEYAEQYGLSSVEELEQYFDKSDIYQNILFDKVLSFLVENATVTQ